ncbi:MAG: hypothetical protein PHS41_13350 [Victivallaceae bacterium]|nr:hypothetical protein [Victivallaceae bacterium]
MMTPTGFTSSAWYAYDCIVLSEIAGRLEREADRKTYQALGAEIIDAINREFYRGNGVYCNGETTAAALALEFALAPKEERDSVVRQLRDAVRAQKHQSWFGLIGAKYVPRALAKNGCVEDGWKVISQPEYPGWMHWIRQGSTTLWEQWQDSSAISHNHILFGDVNAWVRCFLAGISPENNHPAFRSELKVSPYLPEKLNSFRCEITLPSGPVAVTMRREGVQATGSLEMPGGRIYPLRSGETTIASWESEE